VREWPPIADPELVERLALDRSQWADLMLAYARALGPRAFDPALFERALAYPWERPARSYVLRGGGVALLDDLTPEDRQAALTGWRRERHPVVAFGSNAAPTTLTAKFAHFPEAADRDVLVLAGHLHDLDVGAAASPTAYGSMPAALFASPGTAVRAAVLWLTDAQVTQLTWSELGYTLGRLDAARFVTDEADVPVEQLFAYVHRIGAFCVGGEPVALAAVPAEGRTAAAWTQRELLDACAEVMFGAGATAEDLVRAIFADMPAVFTRAREVVWPRARPLPPDRWTRFGTGPAGASAATRDGLPATWP
jgi:hypothetical protein